MKIWLVQDGTGDPYVSMCGGKHKVFDSKEKAEAFEKKPDKDWKYADIYIEELEVE